MDYAKKVDKDEINRHIPTQAAVICFASFEERCTTLANCIDVSSVKKAYIFRNIDPPMDAENSENFRIIQGKLNCDATEISLKSPVSIADGIFSVIREIVDNDFKNLIVDISTFTHEALLMLLKTVSDFRTDFQHIYFVYNGASEYSDWLSKGCKEIRNVIGFPGRFNPSYKDHMIILTGFEKERATQLVELFEPDILSIGNGSEPTDQNHLKTMDSMKSEFEDWFSNLGVKWTSFDFSCSNVLTTIEKIREELNKEDENIIIVPLNTKLSTISAALVALQNERIQVVYPIPEIYNLSYSKPSKNFTILDFKKILNDCI